MLVWEVQIQTVAYLVLQITKGKSAWKPTRIRAEDDAAWADCFVILTEKIFHRKLARNPANPLQAAAGVYTDVGTRPAELQRLTLPGAAKVRYDEVHFREKLGDVVQLEGVDVLVPGNAAGTALDAEV